MLDVSMQVNEKKKKKTPPDDINSPSFNYLKAHIPVVVIIRRSGKSSANSSMNVGVILQQTFHGSVIEVSAMIDRGDFRRRTAKHLGLPSVEMTVEVDHSDWTVGSIQAAQDGEGDCVITAQGDDPGQRAAVLGEALLVGIAEGRLGEHDIVTFFDLANCPFVVIAGKVS